MKIAFIAEGKTEKVFLPFLKKFIDDRLAGENRPRPKIAPSAHDGRIPTEQKLRRVVDNLLADGYDHVIALTDVYTGKNPPEFLDAADAKAKMRDRVGPEIRFHPHAAQYDFEAWLLPYWETIRRLSKATQVKAPWGPPEQVNHGKPPAYRLKEIFEAGKCRDSYWKTRDAARILRESDLSLAIAQCAELRGLTNTILRICGGNEV